MNRDQHDIHQGRLDSAIQFAMKEHLVTSKARLAMADSTNNNIVKSQVKDFLKNTIGIPKSSITVIIKVANAALDASSDTSTGHSPVTFSMPFNKAQLMPGHLPGRRGLSLQLTKYHAK